ncbi:MAG: hypothetical protein KAH48_06200, partial [Chlorobi bacterium]|nr:hypothetical protein [Chlorobiota bacterium]
VTKTLEAASAMDFRERIHIDTLLLKIQFKYAAGMLYKKDEKNNRETAMPTDNRLFGEGVLTYPIGWKLDPFFSASFNTQITESFRMVGDNREATASLWDPVTSIQSWGFEYSRRKAKDNISSRIGFSLKQNRAFHYTKLTDDRETPDIKERWKTESGIQWKTDIVWQIDSSTNYRGMLDLYGTFDDMTKWTVKWTNEFKIKVYAHIGILAKLDLFYDEKQAVYTQYKQALRFGVIADF